MKGNNYPDNLEVVANQKIKERNYWLEKLSGEWSKSTIPYNYGKPNKKNRPGDFADFPSVTFGLSGELFSELMKLSDGADIKLYFLLAAGLVVLIHKYNPYTGSNDIIIGSPIYKQDTEGQFVNTVLTLRNQVRKDMTFKELLFQVRQVIIEANENCNYPVEILAKQLGKPYSRENDFPLFDIVILLDNIHERAYIKHIHNNIGFFFERTDKSIACVLEYNVQLYDRWAVGKIADHLREVFRHVLFDLDVKISEVDMLPEEEKKQVLETFNDTGSEYPRDKTIHELFEEQMGCTPDRIAVVGRGHGGAHITYRELNKRSNHLATALIEKGVGRDTIVGIRAERSVGMIIGILGILKAGGAYLPMDPDYPEERIDYMLKDSGAKLSITTNNLEAPDFPLLPATDHRQPATSLAYVIYTSGSTGKPKGVMVGHRNVIRLVKNTNYIAFTESDRLLYTSAYQFDASTFDIWGSLLNGLTLYPAQKEDIIIAEKLKGIIRKYDIGILNLTTPLFNRLSGVDIEVFQGLGILLVGGDVISTAHVNLVKKRFPGLDIINGYGPTENTTYSTAFLIKKEHKNRIPIGKPISNSTVYIVDKAGRLVPVGAVGELWVGGDGVARGYLNNPELTAEKFVCYRSYRTYISYKTGDLARWLLDGNIEFLGRMDHQVKIRGYRVELREIEERLLSHDGIKEVVVIDREEQGGDKYLCAYIVPAGGRAIDRESVCDHLSRFLPDYMMPSYVMNIDKIPLNPNGKVDRKALPEPVLTDRQEYTGPRNKLEEKLAALWRRILGVDVNTPIGIDDNFFSLGGHSLKATALISNIHKEWEIELLLEQMFKCPTIRGLSEYIDRNRTARSKFFAVEPVEEKDYYPLSAAQKRIYIIQQMEIESTRYNMPYRFPLAGEIDKERLERTFKQLIRRHESLRTSFHMIDDEPVQKIHHDVAFEIENIILTAKTREDTRIFVHAFDLSKAPQLRVGLIKNGADGAASALLMIEIHHIISDGTSQDILVRDFTALYADGELAPLRLRYKDYSEWQNSETQQAIMKSQEKYWLREFSGELPVLNLPTDYPRPLIQNVAGRQLSFTIDKEMTGMIKELCRKTDATLYMVLLGVITILLYKLSGQEDIIVGIPTAGRRHADLQDIIGMFVNTLSMRNYPSGDKGFIEFLKEVKERTLEAYENQEYQFEDLVEKVSVRRDTGRNPIFDVVFNFLNQADYQGQDRVSPAHPELIEIIEDMGESKANFDIIFQGTEIEDMIYFSINYCTALYKGETIRRFIDYFKKLLVEIRENPSRKLSSLEILPEEEKNRLLFDFNDTAAEYPGEKIIHQLFEEQAEKAPQRMAAVGREKKTGEIMQLTYGELNQKSNRLTHSLKEKGVLADSIIGIMMERSVEMITVILGILKAGGAYLPIDPAYPRERIDYMLKDSNAALLLTGNELFDIFKDPFKKSPLERGGPTGPGCVEVERSASLAYIIYTSGTTGKPRGCMIEHRNLVRLLVNDRFPFDFGPNDTWTLFHSYCFDFSVWEMWGAFGYGGRLIIVPGMIARDPHRFLELVKKEQVTVLNQTPAAFYHLSDEVLSNKEKSLHIRYIIFGGEALAPARLKEWQDNYPQTKLINMYGITETTVHVTFKEITQREIRLNESNIGKPIPTLNLYITDKYGKLQPLGVAGELWVGGAGVSRGYLNNPELTAEKFVCYRSYRSYRTYSSYRTGDQVRWLPNGEMEYLGRIDQQVKIRGFRVELGEIEFHLKMHPEIKEVVVINGSDGEKQFLCAYYAARRSGLSVPDLRKYLAEKLPDYMIPAYFIRIDKIPLTDNGKLDRKMLPQPQKADFPASSTYAAPRTGLQRIIAETWKDVLGRDKVGIRDNFFDLGGNSLDAVKVSNKLKEKLKRQIPVVTLFTYPTIHSLEEYLNRDKGSEAPDEQESQSEPDRFELLNEGKSFMQQTLKKLDDQD